MSKKRIVNRREPDEERPIMKGKKQFFCSCLILLILLILFHPVPSVVHYFLILLLLSSSVPSVNVLFTEKPILNYHQRAFWSFGPFADSYTNLVCAEPL